jgi:hypothetical protein
VDFSEMSLVVVNRAAKPMMGAAMMLVLVFIKKVSEVASEPLDPKLMRPMPSASAWTLGPRAAPSPIAAWAMSEMALEERLAALVSVASSAISIPEEASSKPRRLSVLRSRIRARSNRVRKVLGLRLRLRDASSMDAPSMWKSTIGRRYLSGRLLSAASGSCENSACSAGSTLM